MEPVTSETIRAFLQQLSERYTQGGQFYLLGGSALCLLGSPRETRDIDYMAEIAPDQRADFQAVIDELGRELRLDLEAVPLAEFIPLPPEAYARRRALAHIGQLEVYIFDLYSIALSKIARGFEADLDDVLFMLRENLIDLAELEKWFNAVLPQAAQTDIAPQEFRAYFDEVRQRWAQAARGD